MIERNVRGDIPLAQESEFGMDLVLFAKGDVLHIPPSPYPSPLWGEGKSLVQTGNIVYKTDWVHSLHIILYGKEVTYHAVENNKYYGPKDSAYCRLAKTNF